MLKRKINWAFTTLVVCAGLWCCLNPQTTDAAGKGGKAVEISVVGADGQPLSGAHVEFLRQGGKPYDAMMTAKNAWLLKDADDKVSVSVRGVGYGGTIELTMPDTVKDVVSFIVTVSGAELRAEVVGGVESPSAPGKPAINTEQLRMSTRSAFNDANRAAAPSQKALSASTRNSTLSDAAFLVPPANDNCADAAPVGSLPASVAGTNVDATDDAGSPSCGFTSGPFKNIWYSVVGTGETITVSTCNAGTAVTDTKISVFCNDCANKACVGGDDDACGADFGTFKSIFSFCSEAGRTYLITIGGFSASTATGAIQVDVSSSGTACTACEGVCTPAAVPANDTCSSALAMGPLPDSETVNNALATNDTLPACGSAPHNKSTWYSVVGDGTTYTVTTCNDCTSVADTEVVVYCGDCAGLLCIGGDDDGCPATPPGTFKSTFSWCTQAGATYIIAVGNFSSTAVGRVKVDVSSSGTACAGAIGCLTVTGACCVGTTCTATLEEDDCLAAGGTWYVGQSCPAFACPVPCGAGDTCATASSISSLPFNDSANTCDCANDYDSVCPYTGSLSGDTVYSYTPSSDQCVDVSLCNGSDYDTKVYIYANDCTGSAIACNDDLCTSPNFPSPYVSSLSGVTLTGGTTYYFVVDGYGGECGNYVLDITQVNCPAPCGVCPPGGVAENEPNCGLPSDTVNGGCNSAPTVFSPAVCGQDICATSAWDGSTRDTDWYQITVVADTEFTWTVTAEFDGAVIGMVETSPLGNPDCATATALDPFAVGGVCGEISVTRCVPPGTYWWFVAADFAGPTFACGADYVARLDCVGCTPPTCVGDTCETAQVIPSTPFNDVGDSCLCGDNYDEICPYNTPGSSDKVYSYTPSVDECVDITMCANSAYDSKLYVYQGSCGTYQSGTAIACNDDECTTPSYGAPYVSEVTGVNLLAGQTYYIVVDGYAGACGTYTFDIGPCAPPCDVVCSPSSTPEIEPDCGLPSDTVNGGCNSAPPVFAPLACGQSYCGTAAFDGGTRDTDWYLVTVGGSTRFTWTATSEFASLTGPVPTSPAGTGSCNDVLGVIDPALFGVECVTDSVVTECLPAGSYMFFMAPTFEDTVECGKEYEVNLSCEPCVIPLGACCRPDGSCDDGIAEAACENWQGDGTLCANVSCPQPPPNDLCDNAITVAIPSVTAGDTSLATFDSGLPATCGTSINTAGVWYKVIGNGNTISLDTCNGATTYDSKISVFCPNCQAPACVTGNDDACGPTGLQTAVSWCSAPGETYLILVHGFGGQTGPFELVVTNGAACSNPPSCIVVPVCGGGGDCCVSGSVPGCNDASCCETVCGFDPFCCDVVWDQFCADEAVAVCPGCAPEPPTGGCCRGAVCTIETQSGCAVGNGNYLGDNSSCAGPDVPGNSYVDNPGLLIPDGPALGVSDTMNVPDSFTIADLNVDLVIPHTWVGDLVVTIEHNATSVTIVDQPGVPALGSFGCSEDNYAGIVCDDEGSGGPIEDACSPDLISPPNYTPNNPLSAFDGMNAGGTWTITVTDLAGFDTGSLEQWSLHFGQPGPSPCIASGACCFSPTACAVTTPEDCTGEYLGDNTNCSAAGPVTVYAADPGLAIPDNDPANPATHSINVPDSYTLTDVEIDLDITHTWVGDLIVEVEHNSTIVVIVEQPGVPALGSFGCSEDNYTGVVIDGQGTGGSIENACAPNLSSPPNYTPNNPLSVFNGMNSSGAWTIRVSDNAGFDTGTLDHWSLHLTQPGEGPCSGVGFCGNGTVEGGEECDDGNASNTDACLNDCTDASCGDGFVNAGVEQCDDGNAVNNDGCTNACTTPRCGDGIVQAGEQCDDGNVNNADGCSNSCALPTCGDGILQVGEQCDDDNNVSGDGCSATCNVEDCGNNFLDPGEECDGIVDSACGPTGICRTDCTCEVPDLCGNNTLDDGEQCDGHSDDACPGRCLQNCTCRTTVPAVSEWGLIGLAILLLSGVALKFGRKRAATT